MSMYSKLECPSTQQWEYCVRTLARDVPLHIVCRKADGCNNDEGGTEKKKAAIHTVAQSRTRKASISAHVKGYSPARAHHIRLERK
jgi:hypothetical protein